MVRPAGQPSWLTKVHNLSGPVTQIITGPYRPYSENAFRPFAAACLPALGDIREQAEESDLSALIIVNRKEMLTHTGDPSARRRQNEWPAVLVCGRGRCASASSSGKTQPKQDCSAIRFGRSRPQPCAGCWRRPALGSTTHMPSGTADNPANILALMPHSDPEPKTAYQTNTPTGVSIRAVLALEPRVRIPGSKWSLHQHMIARQPPQGCLLAPQSTFRGLTVGNNVNTACPLGSKKLLTVYRPGHGDDATWPQISVPEQLAVARSGRSGARDCQTKGGPWRWSAGRYRLRHSCDTPHSTAGRGVQRANRAVAGFRP
jgi:hypothetical protein